MIEILLVGLVVLIIAGLVITRLGRRTARDDELKLPRRPAVGKTPGGEGEEADTGQSVGDGPGFYEGPRSGTSPAVIIAVVVFVLGVLGALAVL